MDEDTQKQPERTVILQDESLKQFQGGFTAIPNRILQNNELSLGARMTYAMLLKYAWQDEFCFPAQESIANDLGVTDRSVRTFLNELQAAGLITWKRQGLNRPNIYYILKLPERGGGKDKKKPGAEKFSAPDRQSTSAPDRQSTSGYEYSYNEYSNNVNVAFKNGKGKNAPGPEPWKEEALIDEIATQLNDRNPKSRAAFRKIIQTLGTEVVWHILGNTKEAYQAGAIKGRRAPYFIGMAKNIASDRGLDLGFGSPRGKAVGNGRASDDGDAHPLPPELDEALQGLKAKIGNRSPTAPR